MYISKDNVRVSTLTVIKLSVASLPPPPFPQRSPPLVLEEYKMHDIKLNPTQFKFPRNKDAEGPMSYKNAHMPI